MPRKLKLSPLQRDILVTLEEAGSEEINTLISMIRPDDLKEFNRQVDELIGLGLVRKEESRNETELVLTDTGEVTLRT